MLGSARRLQLRGQPRFRPVTGPGMRPFARSRLSPLGHRCLRRSLVAGRRQCNSPGRTHDPRPSSPPDVLVIGGGIAALCAAIAAREAGAGVCLLEQAPRWQRGGNTRHSRNFRVVHAAPTPFSPGRYTEDEYLAELRAAPRRAGAIRRWRGCWCGARPGCRTGSPRTACRSSRPATALLPPSRRTVFCFGGGMVMLNTLYARAQRLGVDLRYATRPHARGWTAGACAASIIADPTGRQQAHAARRDRLLRRLPGRSRPAAAVLGRGRRPLHRPRRAACARRGAVRPARPGRRARWASRARAIWWPWTPARRRWMAASSPACSAFPPASWWTARPGASTTRRPISARPATPPGAGRWRACPGQIAWLVLDAEGEAARAAAAVPAAARRHDRRRWPRRPGSTRRRWRRPWPHSTRRFRRGRPYRGDRRRPRPAARGRSPHRRLPPCRSGPASPSPAMG